MNATTKALVEQADAKYSEGDFDEAEALYRKALQSEPHLGRVEGQLGLIALWRNDLVAAEAYLKAASQDAPWMMRCWPLSTQIDYHLAMVYSRAGRVREAAALLRKAAGLLPIGPFKSLRISAEQMALFEDESFYRIEGPDESGIPFIVTDPLPVVQLSINGSEPVNFFIDTGGEGVILDRAYAEEIGVASIGESMGEYAGGKAGVTGFAKVDEIRLGSVVISNVPVGTLDLKPISQRVFSGQSMAGILGTGFLMRFLSTIDYSNQRLVLRRQVDTEAALSVALGLDGSERQFPMWQVETHLIFSQGSVNGLETVQMLIDTGLAGAAFMTSKATFEVAGVEMDWSKASIGIGAGGEVKALEVEVNEVALGSKDNMLRKHDLRGIVAESEMSIFKGGLGFKVGGLISHQFFRDLALTFDFQHMRLIVH